MMTSTTIVRNYREENAELWDLLRRSQSRLANIKMKTPEYDTDTTSDDSSSYSDEGRDDSMLLTNDDEYEEDDCSKDDNNNGTKDYESTKENIEENTTENRSNHRNDEKDDDVEATKEDKEKTIEENPEESRNDDEKIKVRDYEREHREVLYLLEQSKKRLSKTSTAVLDDEEESMSSDEESSSSYDGTNCWDEEDDLSLSLNDAEEAQCNRSPQQEERIFDMNDKEFEKAVDTIETTPTTVVESLRDNFDEFFDEDFEIAYTGSHDDNEIRIGNLKPKSEIENDSSSKIMITTTEVNYQEQDSNGWDWDDDDDDDHQPSTPMKSIWNKAQDALAEVTAPEPEEEDNFFDFFDSKFDSTFGAKEPKTIASRTSLQSEQNIKPTSMTTAINQVLVESKEEEEVTGPLSMLWSATRNVVKTAVKTVADEFNELDKTMESNASDMSHILEDGEEELDFMGKAETNNNKVETLTSKSTNATEALFPKTEESNNSTAFGLKQDHHHNGLNSQENVKGPAEPPKTSTLQKALAEVSCSEPEEEDNFFDFFDQKFDSAFGPKEPTIATRANLKPKQDAKPTHATTKNITPPAESPKTAKPQTNVGEEYEGTVEDDLKSLRTFLWSSIPKSWSQLQEMGDEAANILS